MVGVTLPDGSSGEVGLELQSLELGLVRAGVGVLLVPAHQALQAGHTELSAWGTGRGHMSEELHDNRMKGQVRHMFNTYGMDSGK